MFEVSHSLKILNSKVSKFPELVIVLGSGWNQVLNATGLKIETEIGYQELFGVAASVPGHDGKLIIAKVGKSRVALMAGRLHMYEGYTAEESTRPIQTFAQAGMKKLVLTAAAGALNEKYQVGDFVVLSDMITMFLSPESPLIGPKFQDVSECFDPEMRKVARQSLVKHDIPFHEGVYVYMHGPHFETPADKMALRFLGADVVGMSTVPETIAARYAGVDVLGLAFVTNLAFVKHEHSDVVAQANKGGEQMSKVLLDLVASA